MSSLRSRLVVGSLLWAVGVLALASSLAITIIHHFPQWQWWAHNVMMAVFAFVCVLLGLSQIRRGMSPFVHLRERLAAVREGRNRRVEGTYPSEVAPLVADLNALLEHRDEMVGRALAKAGDLAHGLKTPLAVLSHEAARAAAAGHTDLAATIAQQVDRMRGQMDYHLAQARAAATGATPGARCSVKESADALARTLLRLHADRGLTIDVNVPPDHVVRGQREDLDEMLGNLLDNACKWAKWRVTVSSVQEGSTVTITVDDDGPGLDPSLRDAVLQRGVRADEAAPGSGFGLAIVRELAELHGGTIALSAAPDGGVRALLRLP